MPSLLFAILDHWRAPAPKPAKVAWLGEWDYAHRGLHGPGVPENSRSAFAAALTHGLGIELDTQSSADGRAMVIHDDTLERTTEGDGPVIHLSASDLETVVLKGGHGDTVATLERVLADVAGQVPVLVEIKSSSHSQRRVRAVCLPARRAIEGYAGPVAVMSFDPRVVRWFADYSPLTVRGLVVTEEDGQTLVAKVKRRLALWLARPDFLAYDIRDLPSRFAAEQRRRGLPVLTWTVRNADQRARAARYADAAIAEGAGVG